MKIKSLAGGVFFAALSVFCVAVVIMLTAKGCAAQSVAEPPLLSAETELREALKGRPKLYRLMDMELTGKPATDPYGIFSIDCVYVGGSLEKYVEKSTNSDDNLNSEYETWERTGEYPDSRFSQALTLFGDIPVAQGKYRVDAQTYTDLTKDNIKPDVMQKIQGNYYYPTGPGDVLGNTRVQFTLAPVGIRAAFYATIGDGTVTLQGFDGEDPVIYLDGTESDLDYIHSESGIGGAMLGWIFAMPLAAAFGVIAYNHFFNYKYGEPAPKKKKGRK